jgi:hypothetical protein
LVTCDSQLVGGEEQLRLETEVPPLPLGLSVLAAFPLGGASLAKFFGRPRGMIEVILQEARSTLTHYHFGLLYLRAAKCNRFGGSGLRAKAQIRLPMHAAGLCRKRRKGVWTAAEPHSNGLRLAEITKPHAALLAGIC